MKIEATLCAILAATACGGTSSRAPATGPAEIGSGSGEVTPPPEVADPQLAARKAYVDPGGMWLPEQMTLAQHVRDLKALGAEVAPEALARPLEAPLAAVVSLGYCTGSFVSPDGLIVTNHHCVQGALRYISSDEHDYVDAGFLAGSRAEEPWVGPTQHLMVARAIRDVTAAVRDGLEAIEDPIARKKELDRRRERLMAECEKDRPEVRCRVYGQFRGARYQLVEYLDLRDVRMVYAPARSIGDYGGEIDNWAWPRHSGEWAFLRAYVGKDGKPADFAPDNVPYHSAHWLEISTEGVKDHDFVMVAGYPGHTQRLETAREVRFLVEEVYPRRVEELQAHYDVAAQIIASADGEARILATVAQQFIQNKLEYTQGVLAGVKQRDLLARKDEVAARVRAWAAQPGRDEYRSALERLDQLDAEEQQRWRAEHELDTVLHSSQLLEQAFVFLRMAEERSKPDAERKPGFQERDRSRLEADQKAFGKRYDRGFDRADFRRFLIRALALPAEQRPWLPTVLGLRRTARIDAARIDAALDKMYGKTRLEDPKVRLDLLAHATSRSLARSRDPFLRVAVALWPTVKQREAADDRMTGEMALVAPKYAEALLALLDGKLAPDADGSLRVNYGTVRGFHPESTAAADRPFTLAREILTKDTGKPPYDAPPALLAAIRAGDFGPYRSADLGGLPVNFLTDLDTTGGNSGSPTLDSRGRLVGLVFDGNIEGVADDLVFDEAVSRSIHVDIRYLLWVMDAVDSADHLLQEMGVQPRL